MGYSNLHKFIFLKLQKAGGTSIENVLIKNLKKEYCPDVPNHIHYNTFKNKIGEEKINDFLKFAVTRNPWERIFSLYLHWMRHYKYHNIYKYKNEISINSFKEFLIDFSQNEKNITQWMLDQDNNKIIGNYYLRFNYLEQDIKKLFELLNIKINYQLEVLNTQKDLKKKTHYVNASDYVKYYDEENKLIVDKLLKTEIVFFGYTFLNSDPTKNFCCYIDNKL